MATIDDQIDRLEIEKVLKTQFKDVAFLSNAILVIIEQLAVFANDRNSVLSGRYEEAVHDAAITTYRIGKERNLDETVTSAILDLFVRVTKYIYDQNNGGEN